ncbi:MAG: hypothetical protein DRJ51_08845 [Thermoprotei archaeon]|nr:MAG: hypothetical protein DRJ51_08845 [Thermoprotei archaeon]RLF02017.1 MAG: hypothetical protein DRJ59_04730 [Thermoprotei archaeon]
MEKRFINVPDPRNPKRLTKGLIVKFKPVKEEWSEYELEDGTRVRAKLVVQSIAYVIDPDTGEIMRNPLKEPIINVRHTVVITAEFPEEKVSKVEESGSK